MIELVWTDKNCKTTNECFVHLIEVFEWLLVATGIDMDFNGFMILKDDKDAIYGLILCNGEIERSVLNILQDPPKEYEGKYSYHSFHEEPKPVSEVKVDENNEDEVKIIDESKK